MGGRIIGIRHRIKVTKEGEARPTEVAIFENAGGSAKTYKLENELDELDFVFSRFPCSYREEVEGEDLSKILSRHKKDRKLSIPSSYEGLKAGDTVVSMLGGSGRKMIFALSRKAEQIGAKVFWVSSGILNKFREGDKEKDAENVAHLFIKNPELFHEVMVKDRELILLREKLNARLDAMKARIACEQRLLQRMIGNIFCGKEGLYPEGEMEELFDEEKANDSIFQSLLSEEMAREKELTACVSATDVYKNIFEPIEGCGPMIASRIIASIGDIRRFEGSVTKFKAYCGVHLRGGNFARRRNNEAANWSNEIRQAMYLLGEQFNRRPNSVWGIKFCEYKEKMRAAHPETIGENGKKKYTPIHIHRMAKWRTLTKFAEKLFKEWNKQ